MPYETICQISDFLEQFSEDWIGGDETGGWGYEPEKVEQLLAYAAMLLEKLKEAAAHE